MVVLEILGTIAFAVSGTFVAIKAKFDVFGVLVIGCITAVGGGIMRDILIGETPPLIFTRLYIVAVAGAVSMVAFVTAYVKRASFDRISEKIEHVNNIFDAIGLAAFTAMGTELAFTDGVSDNVFLSITLGALTGVGGGLLRDVLTGTSPYIFRKHVYAVATIFGAAIYYAIRVWTDNTVLPSIIAVLFIIVIRLLATKYRWNLPKIIITEEKNKSDFILPPQTEEAPARCFSAVETPITADVGRDGRKNAQNP